MADATANLSFFFLNHQLFYFWVVFCNRMGVMFHIDKTPILHLCKILYFIPQRETLRSCDAFALSMERTLNALSDHDFKLSKRTIINQMCAIDRSGGRFASLYPIHNYNAVPSHHTFVATQCQRAHLCSVHRLIHHAARRSES